MRIGEWILLKLSRKPGSNEYAGATLNYTVDNALDFPKKTIPGFLDRIKDKSVLDFGCGPGYQAVAMAVRGAKSVRSEEHTSELQSRLHLVCRLLLEKKKRGQ